ncbi:hypothetical protein [Streptomyces sp. NPDC018031]|uniref:hypothetical protein n=1 Tax=Streptomyces sp. NPDC018031 TaxID=3365033 RepID=UPI003796FD62
MSAADTTVPRPTPEPRPVRSPLAAVQESLRSAAPALAVYAAVRLTSMLCLAVWAWHVGKHPRTLLGRSWDSVWYVGIAQDGYGTALPSRIWPGISFSDLAFFPLFPGLVRAVAAVTPLGTVSAGLLVAWASAGAAAWGVHAVARLLYGRRVALCAVVLWGLLPHAIVQSMAYTEPLLTALAAWSLYALLTGRWLWAGSLALLAGLSRPNGLAVAAAVCACAAATGLRRITGGARAAPGRGRAAPGDEPVALSDGRAAPGHGRAVPGHGQATPGDERAAPGHGQAAPCDERAVPGRRPAGWRIPAAAALAPLGWLGYLGWVGVRRDDPLGYFRIQEDWGSRFDFGRDTLEAVRRLVLDKGVLAYHMTLALLVAALLLLVLLVLDRPPLALLVYTLVLMAIAFGGAGYFASKPRFLLPAFPLLLPLALAMARARPRTAVVTAVALAGLSWLYGTYLLTVAPVPI